MKDGGRQGRLKSPTSVKQHSLPWIVYDSEERRRKQNAIDQLKLRKERLIKYAPRELDAVAQEMDRDWRERMETMAFARWKVLQSVGQQGIALIRNLEIELTSSFGGYTFVEGCGREEHRFKAPSLKTQVLDELGTVSEEVFWSLLKSDQKKQVTSRKIARQLFQGFSAMKYLRSNLVVCKLDTMDTRELVVASRLFLPNARSALDRLSGDLFSVFHHTHITEQQVGILLTVGVQTKQELDTLLERVSSAWRTGIPPQDKPKGRITRRTFRKVLLERELADLMTPAKPTPGRPIPQLVCAWEWLHLPDSVSRMLLQARQHQQVETMFLSSRHRKSTQRQAKHFETWRNYVEKRKLGRKILGTLFMRWRFTILKRCLVKMTSHAVQVVAVHTLQAFYRRIVCEQRILQREVEALAPIPMQALVRGFLHRKKFAALIKARELAVPRIQRFWRSRMLAYRTKLHVYYSLKAKWDSEKRQACIAIQRVLRGYLGRRRVLLKRRQRVQAMKQDRWERQQVARTFLN